MAPTSALCTLSLNQTRLLQCANYTYLKYNTKCKKTVNLNIPVKNGSNSCAVCIVTLQLRGQKNSIIQSNGAMGERGNEELIPP